jgi:hypothetical protein
MKKLVRNITPKEFGEQAYFKDVVADGKNHDVFVIVGEVKKTIPKETNYGTSQNFKGKFIAKALEGSNLEKGTEIAGTGCYLPEFAEELTLQALEENDNQPIQIGFVMGVEPCEKGNTGYKWTNKPLIEPEESNPLQLLLEAKGY